jgi:sulfur carrier protein
VAVKISVNSKEHALPPECTVEALLHQLGFAEKRVAVEVNQELVLKSQWAEVRLKDGDRVEIVSFVGGG